MGRQSGRSTRMRGRKALRIDQRGPFGWCCKTCWIMRAQTALINRNSRCTCPAAGCRLGSGPEHAPRHCSGRARCAGPPPAAAAGSCRAAPCASGPAGTAAGSRPQPGRPLQEGGQGSAGQGEKEGQPACIEEENRGAALTPRCSLHCRPARLANGLLRSTPAAVNTLEPPNPQRTNVADGAVHIPQRSTQLALKQRLTQLDPGLQQQHACRPVAALAVDEAVLGRG